MTSHETDDVIWGNFDDLMWNAKTGVNIYKLLKFRIKVSEYIDSSTDLCCIVFGKNRNSLSIQKGTSKFAKFVYLIFIILSGLEGATFKKKIVSASYELIAP